jgi:hypothetical protein
MFDLLEDRLLTAKIRRAAIAGITFHCRSINGLDAVQQQVFLPENPSADGPETPGFA